MFDIHCHLLPGIDDGASTIEQSLELARFAVNDGITHMVCTPHIQPGVYNNNVATIRRAYEAFAEALAKNSITLKVAMAAEVRLCPEIIPMLERDDLPLYLSSEGRRTILLELPHSHVPPGTERLIQWLQAGDIDVLLAHPERNKELMHNIDKLFPFVSAGCKLQVTAGAVAGYFGADAQRAAAALLQRGWVTVLATDAHNLRHRPPQLSAGKHAASALIGAQHAHAMVLENPRKLVEGMFTA